MPSGGCSVGANRGWRRRQVAPVIDRFAVVTNAPVAGPAGVVLLLDDHVGLVLQSGGFER